VLIHGLSRIYLRLHYASYVIAGYCFGLLALILMLRLLNRAEKMKAKALLKI
jgi:membrane-associated phospholipid phosphatase